MEEKMKNINEITKEEAQKIEYILTDIDGTLTNDGPMLPAAYEALWKLHDAGFKIIPVTGRTAGWASVNITDWPVEAIIAESGSVVFYLENGSRKSFIHPSISGDIAAEHEKILRAVRKNIRTQRSASTSSAASTISRSTTRKSRRMRCLTSRHRTFLA